MPKKLDNQKTFERFDQKWAETYPPSKPCQADLIVFKKLFDKYLTDKSKENSWIIFINFIKKLAK